MVVLLFAIFLCVIFLMFFRPKDKSVIEEIFICASKKRKNDDENIQKLLQKFKSQQNFMYYKRLVVKKQYTKFPSKTIRPTYVEMKLNDKTNKIKEVAKLSYESLKKVDEKFRAIGKETIIEKLASFYASQILAKPMFNVYAHFEQLSKVFKIYKKEASVLAPLIVDKLISVYLLLLRDISKIKSDVEAGSKLRRIGKMQSFATIYGAYKFNPLSTKLFAEKRELVIQSTNKLLDELDTIENRQTIIYNYIVFLSRQT